MAPYPAAHVLPAKVEAEHFDEGGEGVAYHDVEPSNLGTDRALRPGEGVDIETEGGVTAVCFVRAGEFLNYSVDATAAGNVTLTLRAANPEAAVKGGYGLPRRRPRRPGPDCPDGRVDGLPGVRRVGPARDPRGPPRRDHRVRGGRADEPRLAELRDGGPDHDADGDANRHGDGDADRRASGAKRHGDGDTDRRR